MSGFAIVDGVPEIDGHKFPWAEWVRNSDAQVPGHTHNSRGFHLRFENGWLLSIQWGSGTYSSNYRHGFNGGEWHEESPDAEVWGWWGKDGARWPINDEDVLANQTPDEVLALIVQAREWASPKVSA